MFYSSNGLRLLKCPICKVFSSCEYEELKEEIICLSDLVKLLFLIREYHMYMYITNGQNI